MISILNEGWKLKTTLSAAITTPAIDGIIGSLTKNGDGAKLCGAGTGGYIMVMTKGRLFYPGAVPIKAGIEGTKRVL